VSSRWLDRFVSAGKQNKTRRQQQKPVLKPVFHNKNKLVQLERRDKTTNQKGKQKVNQVNRQTRNQVNRKTRNKSGEI
jgi:hypothetical protein